MCTIKKASKKNKGIALLISLIFVAVFSALSAAMFMMSTANARIARNLHTVNQARSSAESGLEVIRYYAQKITLPGSTLPENLFSVFRTSLQSVLPSNLNASYDADNQILTVGSADAPVMLDSSRSFYAEISPASGSIQIRVRGQAGSIGRTILGGFSFGIDENTKSAFDFGVATKGPLSLKSLTLDGVNLRVESDVYIESSATNSALTIQNAQIAGDVKIVNPSAFVTMSGGQSSIGGEKGAGAIQNHVEIGVSGAEFPVPNPAHFERYVNGITINSSNKSLYSNNATLENVRIAAGTNPKFTGNTTIKGVLYIEQPNVVEFGGNANITGVIVGNGSLSDNSATNQLNFTGTVVSTSVANLPQTEKFAGLHSETGTFIMAPGFAVSFGGNFGTLNGCIAANGVRTYGSAGGVIGGSIVNYSTEPMRLEGSDLFFNRTGITDIPAGFEINSDILIYYNPSAYDEVL